MGEMPSSQRLLAENLKKFRKLLGWSQMRLAEECGLSTNFISELEGAKVWLSPETLDKLATVIGVPASSLFKEEDGPVEFPPERLEAIAGLLRSNSEAILAELVKRLREPLS